MVRLTLFAIFLLVPIIEVALFMSVGGYIGIAGTIGLIVLTAFLGAILVRRQGLGALQHMRSELDRGKPPVEPILHGVMILAAGLLLVTPGFATDTVGFALLVPSIRTTIATVAWSWLQRHVDVQTHNTSSSRPDSRTQVIIEGEAVEIETDKSTKAD